MTHEKLAHHLATNHAPQERMTLETAILEALDRVRRDAIEECAKIAAKPSGIPPCSWCGTTQQAIRDLKKVSAA